MFRKIRTYVLHHQSETAILIFTLVVSAFFRLYKISDYMTFLGDEGRDALIAKGILEGDFTLLGPRASAGDFFLGPVYYYMIAPFLYLTGLNPVGPAIMVALFGIATVFLVYFVGKKFFGLKGGLIAAALYAISPLVVAYSRSSWNPNLMPFFSILLLFLLYKAIKDQSLKIIIAVGFLLGVAIQLHYLTTFLGVIVLFYILVGNFIVSKKNLFRRYLFQIGGMILGFILSISPFLLFEIKHGFPNTKTIFRFIFADNATEGYSIGQSFTGNIFDVTFRLFGRLITKFPPSEQVVNYESFDLKLWQIATILLAFFSVVAILKVKDGLKKLLLAFWLFFGIALFGFYKKPIYDYYFGFMFPLPFLLVGNFLSQVSEIRKYKKVSIFISGLIFVCLLFFNLTGAPFLFPGNKQKDQARNIALSIIEKANSDPYNFALLTNGNSDHVYRYFLEVEGRAPVTVLSLIEDPQRKSVTDQLIVVCEQSDCQPLGHPLWEIAGFGRAEIEEVWEVPFVKIFKLRHYRGN